LLLAEVNVGIPTMFHAVADPVNESPGGRVGVTNADAIDTDDVNGIAVDSF